MKPESIVLAIAGAFFGLIVGWVIGSQQAAPPRVSSAPTTAAQPAQGGQAQAPAGQAPRQLDEAQVQALQATAAKAPGDAQVRVQLGNLYFDAERYQDAVTWYQQALKLNPKDVDVSTDLGVSYYQLQQPDRALEQFDESLKIDPKHTKTMLNIGIVRAFGKQDLPGAVAAWEKLIAVAPDSPEAATAKRALEGIRSAHPGIGGGAAGTTTPGKPAK